MKTISLQNELHALKKLKNNWYSVAVIVSKIKEAASGSAHPSRRLKEASDACGYSPNTLNRMLVVKEFLDGVKDAVPELKGIDANALPFTTLEIVKRLHQVDPQQGLRMLLEVVAGRITIRKLREVYDHVVANKTDVASTHQLARFEAREFEDAALLAVQASLAELFERPLKLSVQRVPPISVVGCECSGDESGPSVGFDFVLARGPEASVNLESVLHRSLFYGSFFTRFWIIFSSNVGEQRIRSFCNILKTLEIASIGVAVLPWGKEEGVGGHLRIAHYATGIPSPDWRDKVESIRDLRNSINSQRK